MTSHYNTTNEKGATLRTYEDAAKSLEERIILLMREQIEIPRWSPTRLHGYFNNVPITSVRRALTNLTKEGRLYKSEVMSVGGYGRREHNWVLIEKGGANG